MALPWVRLDSSIASHDKILSLIGDPSPARWQAVASYMFALGWSGLQETDGRIPVAALPFVHGNAKTARLLVKHRLWIEAVTGFQIVNYGSRQQLSSASEAKVAQLALASLKANCVRWHGDSCWKAGKCSKGTAA
jgi:hypothetical protein